MKKLLLSAALLFVTSAHAADMPAKAPAFVAPVAPVTLSSFYLGVNGAGAQTDGKFDFLNVPGTGTLHPSGGMAGLTAGFGSWLGGLYLSAEADASYDWTHQNITCVAVLDCKMKSSWFLDQRLVVGWALGSLTGQVANTLNKPAANWPVPLSVPDKIAAANLMPFVTGGIAERRFEACVEGLCGEKWIIGPTFGGGIRLPITTNFSVDVTYLHTWYNKHFEPSAILPATFKATTEDALMLHLLGHF